MLQKNRIFYMGCEPSNLIDRQENTDSASSQFEVGHRQLVWKDRGDVFQFYHFSKMIHRSATSIIRKIIHRSTKVQRICKIVPLSRKDCIGAIRQAETLRLLDHPNIVKIYQYFLEGSFLYIVLQEIPGQNLIDYVLSNGGLTYRQILTIMKQLLSAVEYLHSNNYAHRIITMQNIMISPGKVPIVKLIDFSQSCVRDNPKPPFIPRCKRNSFVCPSEIDEKYSMMDRLDIWSCGVVLYYLLTGQYPKNLADNKQNIIEQMRKQSKYIKDAIDLLEKMTYLDPLMRPTAKQCLQHALFNKKDNFQLQQRLGLLLGSMMKLKIGNKLDSLLWMYASLNYSTFKDKAQYMLQFQNLDRNNDGKLQYQQIVQGLENSFNVSKQQAQAHAKTIFEVLDKNKNGFLDYSQFVMGTMQTSKLITESTIKKMFNQIDFDHDGYITEQQLSNLLDGYHQGKILQNKSRKINFAQFQKTMQSIIQQENSV